MDMPDYWEQIARQKARHDFEQTGEFNNGYEEGSSGCEHYADEQKKIEVEFKLGSEGNE